MLLQQEEAIENGSGPTRKNLVVAQIEKLVDSLELLVDGYHLHLGWEQPRMQVLQQDDVELADRLGSAVVALHEQLGGAPRWRIREPELVRQRGLHVEHEPIFSSSSEVVQPHAELVEESLVPQNLARLC